ncbi:MAG: polysulfide reductase NrfD [Alphaproteobacteria bacterium]|nr:polysulfide reductase NrfD [Alphaproteobacteria bacterium]
MEHIAPWLQTSWDRRAAGNFIGGGTGSGLAMIAAASALWSGNLQRPPLAVAALAIAAGLALVWLEIGRPWRFLHVFFHPQTSWMTREALLAPPLLLALAAAAWTGDGVATAFAALLALAFLYSQARILRAAQGIPAWREPAIVPLMLATGFADGAGAFLALAAADTFVLVVAIAAIIARWFAWTTYRRRLGRNGAPIGALAALTAIDAPVLLLGTVAPLVLLVAALVLPRLAVPLALAAGLLALGSGWLVKGVIVTRAAFNQGFALPHLPRRRTAGEESSAPKGG